MKLTVGNQSVAKTIHIIEALAASSTPLRLSELAGMVDMPSSTALRMLATLVNLGYVYQEESDLRRYGLTMRFSHLGQSAADPLNIREIGHPLLLQLTAEQGESCCLAIEESYRVRYIDVVEGKGNLITIRQRIGGSAMMHCTASGKLFLMQYAEAELDRFIAEKGLPKLTTHTFTDKQELMYELSVCKKQGYAIDDEECEVGMRCVAAPVFDINQRVIASVILSGPISRMTRMRIDTQIIPALCKTAGRLTNMIIGVRAQEESEAEQSAREVSE